MKKKIITFAIIAGMVMAGIFLGFTAAPVVAESPQALPDEINVCGVFPIVKRPDAGRDRRDGFLIAIDEINAQTGTDRILPVGKTLVPHVFDDDNTAAGGTVAANNCIGVNAHVVVGSSGSSVSAAMHDVLKTSKIVQLSYASSSPSLSDRTAYPYFMRNVASDADQGVALNDLVQAFGFTKGATISTDDSYGTGLVTVFTTAFEAAGGEVVSAQTFAPGASDVSGPVQALADANPEFVLLNAIDTDAAVALKKARDLDFVNLPWFITDGSSTTATYAGDDSVKDAMQMIIGTNPAPATTSTFLAFNTTWFATTECGGSTCEGPAVSRLNGTAFNSYAPFAYDAAYIVAKGLAAADSVDGDVLLTAMYAVTHTGAGGQYSFNELGEVNSPYDIVQLSGTTYSTIGVWDGTLTLTDGDVTVMGGAVWEAKSNALTCTSGCGASTPGFEVSGVLLFFGFFAAIALIARKKKN